MQRFWRQVMVLFMSTVVVVLAAQLISAARPSRLADWFANPDHSPCSGPCLLGINPGKTPVAQAVALLTSDTLSNPFTQTDKPFNGLTFQNTAGDTLTLALSADGRLVTDISLSPHEASAMTLGEVIDQVGLPDLTWLHMGSGPVTYIVVYLEAQLMVVSDRPQSINDHIDRQAAVTYLIRFDKQSCRPDASAFLFASWRGFTTEQRYYRASVRKAPLRSSGLNGGSWFPCYPQTAAYPGQ
jgi:hypothetical protein